MAGAHVKRTEVPGGAGVAFMIQRWSGEPTSVRTITLLTYTTDAGTFLNAYTAMRTGTYTLTDDWGLTRANIFVHDVQEIERVIFDPATPSKAGWLECEWILEALY